MRSFRIVLSLLALTLACGVFSYAAGNPADEFYSYDNKGNILEKRIGAKTYTYSYDASNQLKSMASEDGVREYIYDEAGRLVEEKLNGETEVEYRYGYLDKVTEVIRKGKSVKYAYDGFGMLTEKRFEDGTIEKWVWDGIALVRRGSDIYVNEPHVSGGVPILTKTAEGVRYHENDYLGTTLWSTDTKGNLLSNYSESTVFGEGSLQASRGARFTGKPYDGDMQAYVFPFRNYNPSATRWMSVDPSGYPDGINAHFYACNPLMQIDPWGLSIDVSASYNVSSGQTLNSYNPGTISVTITATYTGSDAVNALSNNYVMTITQSGQPGQSSTQTDRYGIEHYNSQTQTKFQDGVTVTTEISVHLQVLNDGLCQVSSLVLDEAGNLITMDMNGVQFYSRYEK